MSIIFLILFLVSLAFFISAAVAVVRFWLDVKKYSSYKSELDGLIDKYNKLCPDFEESEVKENV